MNQRPSKDAIGFILCWRMQTGSYLSPWTKLQMNQRLQCKSRYIEPDNNREQSWTHFLIQFSIDQLLC